MEQAPINFSDVLLEIRNQFGQLTGGVLSDFQRMKDDVSDLFDRYNKINSIILTYENNFQLFVQRVDLKIATMEKTATSPEILKSDVQRKLEQEFRTFKETQKLELDNAIQKYKLEMNESRISMTDWEDHKRGNIDISNRVGTLEKQGAVLAFKAWLIIAVLGAVGGAIMTGILKFVLK